LTRALYAVSLKNFFTNKQNLSFMPFAHITVSNKPHPGLDALLLSCKPFDIKTRVLGMGNKTPIGHKTGGFGLKLELLKQELELLPQEQLILFTDAYDVIIQHSLEALEQWFQEESHQNKVLFAAESSKWPLEIDDLFYPSPLQFPMPYLNSGVFAGRAKSILSLLQEPFVSTTDDQGYYSKQFLSGTSCIVLDHRAEFFQCMVGLDAKQIIESNNKNALDFSHTSGIERWIAKPAILHLNSGNTRVIFFSKVILTVLGPQYAYLARQIKTKLITDFLYTNWKILLFAVLVLFVILRFIISF